MQSKRCFLRFSTLMRYEFHLPGYIRECTELPSSGIFCCAANSVNTKQRDVKLSTEADRCRQSNIISFQTRRWVSGLYFLSGLVESSWNVMAHGDAREEKWRGNWRMEWVASTLHTTSEHGLSSNNTADEHTSAASSRLNWRPRRFKLTRPFRRKTKSVFCACAVTFQMQSKNSLNSLSIVRCTHEDKVTHLAYTVSYEIE